VEGFSPQEADMIPEYRDDEVRNSVVIPVGVKEAVRKSCLDQDFRKRLVGQPTAILRTEGVDLPPGIEVEVLEDTDEILHLVLPFNTMVSKAELSDAELASVVGGGRRIPGSKSMYS
jgi:hypothetical protein